MRDLLLKRCLLLATVVVLALGLFGAGVGCGGGSTPQAGDPPQGEDDKAPDFTLATLGGSEVTLSQFEGTPVVLNFWSTKCGFCVKELPDFERIAIDSGGDVVIIAIDVGETEARIKTFFDGYEPTMIVGLDKDMQAFAAYSRKYNNPRGSIPFTILIDSKGRVQDQRLGAYSSEAEIWAAVSQLS